MMICDSQIHLWQDDSPERPWPPGGKERLENGLHRNESMGAAEMIGLMDADGIDRAVIAPPSWAGNRVDYALDSAAAFPGRFAITPWLPLNDPAAGNASLAEWKDQPDIKGARFTLFTPEDRAMLKDGTADWYWEYAQANDFPTLILLPQERELLEDVATRYPGARIIIDHLGVVGVTGDAIAQPIEWLISMARFPNVSVKASAAPGLSEEDFPFADVNPYVIRVIEAFGPARCYWGTDITRLFHKGGYKECVAQFTDHLGLSEGDQELIMGRALCDALGWD